MIKLYLKNKKSFYTCLIGIILASQLFFCVCFLFSSAYKYLIDITIKKDNYHVLIKGDLGNYNKNIKSKVYKSGKYYMVFEDIKKTYEETSNICHKYFCKEVKYNEKLLSLYGLGDNNYIDLMKKILLFIFCILSITMFFVIYNSFKVCMEVRKREFVLYKSLGCSNKDLLKIIFLGDLFISIIGIFLGFILGLIITKIIVFILNNLLLELLEERLKIIFNFTFILIGVFFIFLVIICGSIIPLRNIKKYHIMDMFRKEKVLGFNVNFSYKFFPFSLAYANFKREGKKYRSLIIGIALFLFLINIFSVFIGYTSYITKTYINIPDYDLSVISSDNMNFISDDLKAYKKINFKSCGMKIILPKEYINENDREVNGIVTNLGGNHVINKMSIDNKVKKIFWKKPSLNLNNYYLDLEMSDKIPFGFKSLISSNLVINLNDSEFSKVCPIYSYNLFLKTKENKLDDYLKKLKDHEFTYLNVKKSNEITRNLFLALKVILYCFVFLIWFVSLTEILNVLITSINIRRREFSLYKIIGFDNNYKIILIETLIISLKGFLLSFPFILICLDKLYKCVREVFDVDIILNIKGLVLSFILVYLTILFLFVTFYKIFMKKSLVENLK